MEHEGVQGHGGLVKNINIIAMSGFGIGSVMPIESFITDSFNNQTVED